MAHVLQLWPAGETSDNPAHRRIQWASRALSILFMASLAGYGAFAWMLGLGFFIPGLGRHVGIGPEGMLLVFGHGLPHPYVEVDSLPLVQRLAHMAAGVLVFTPKLAIFWSLGRLFGLYGQGVVFARANAHHIKWIGAWLAADAAAPFAVHLILNALHLAIDQRWAHLSSLQELVLGGIVYVIAQVMEVGREMEEERGQFV